MKKYHVFILLCVILFMHAQNRFMGVEKDTKDGSAVPYTTKDLLHSGSTVAKGVMTGEDDKSVIDMVSVSSIQSGGKGALGVSAVDISVNSNGSITVMDNGVQIGIDECFSNFPEEELRILLSTIYNHAGK